MSTPVSDPTYTSTEYVVRLHHDRGTVTVAVHGHTNPRSAVQSLLAAEHAPASAVRWVRVRPVCEYGTAPATRYVRDSGEGTPLCAGHAKQHAGTAAGARAHTGKLGVTRLLPVPEHEWRELAA
jgi:hypothetical protein